MRSISRRYLTCNHRAAHRYRTRDATFAVRRHEVWGEGSTAVASDSTHFRSYEQNIFTEWHARYGGQAS
ncbi:MAG: Tn3 family transposase [Actinobacteria bacterium]|nr:Tn3 family transposase [Actinomycetota bacterium]